MLRFKTLGCTVGRRLKDAACMEKRQMAAPSGN